MILPVHDRVRARLAEAISAQFGLDAAEVPHFAIEMPPKRAFGDLAVPVAFELARRLRKAPKAIAKELAGAIGAIDGIARVEAAPNGYLNFYIDRVSFVSSAVRGFGSSAPSREGKVIVEHTAINPNKAAHIGHLRNSALGDTLVRVLRFRGWPVEVQNYIDDTGVQVADVVVGFRELEGQTLDGVKKIADGTRFDFYCWDLYARVTEWYGDDTARLKLRGETLHAIEAGGSDVAAMAAFIADRIVGCHLRTMARLNIDYDLLSWEGDILRLQFWATAFEQLKQRGSVYLQTDGKLAGCWVMKIDDMAEREAADGAEDADKEKVIVRSDGTVTYVGKDIAYQFWKFGLLGRDFHYRPFTTREDGSTLWATTSEPPNPRTSERPAFGNASAVYNVIDTRQAYLQKLLKQALGAMGFEKEADHSTHFAYEMVALSHATARELGYDPADSEGRPFVEVSGRKGLGVKADDLLDRLAEKAHLEVARRNEALTAEECRRIGIEIATAAVRYFMVKYSRGKVIAFDIEEALSFEGESGPYLQYAAVRAGNILQKLEERHGMAAASIGAALPQAPPGAITDGEEADELWDLILQASRLDEVAESALRSLELSTLAKFAFTLAQAFNAFYHRQQILREEREDARLWRAAGVAYVRQQLTAALDLIGSSVPSRM
ncbi:MAG TPA: arginine--tRNA ligase [Vicinamibacterales bacterium]|nr:arginine--tRNA ligase [Vicinamibacterales bacterium]